MNDEEAIRFINSLVKNLQVLCHGSVEFKNKVEVIGHLYINVDSDTKFDYVVNEKVCKNEESSTTFVSNSFHAAPKKSLAERKKELEEELAKIQKEQSKQYERQSRQSSDDRVRNHVDHTRKRPLSDSFTRNQATFTPQSSTRNDSYPLSPLQNFKHHFDNSLSKIPRLSFDDMHNYDMSNSMTLQKNSDVHQTSSGVHQTSSGVHQISSGVHQTSSGNSVSLSTSHPSASMLPSDNSSSVTDEKQTEFKIDLSSIKQEYVSQLSDESACVFDRGRYSSGQDPANNQMFNSSLPRSNFNALVNSPDYKITMNSQSNQRIRSNSDQTSQNSSNSPGASSLGSPRGSTCVQSPPSSSQGLSGVEQIVKQESRWSSPVAKDSLIVCECGKTFRTNSGYADHKRCHDGNYRYICPICSKGCNNKQQFIGHMNKHSNNKPFKCDVCGRAFTLKHNLVQHQIRCLKQ